MTKITEAQVRAAIEASSVSLFAFKRPLEQVDIVLGAAWPDVEIPDEAADAALRAAIIAPGGEAAVRAALIAAAPHMPAPQVVRITTTEHGFDLITVPIDNGGEATFPFEYTPSPHLVITASAIDDQNRPGFGCWRITHVPTGVSIPVPQPHVHDVDTVRWFAHQLAAADIDWSAPLDTLKTTVAPVMADLIRQADETDQANTPPGQLAVSTLRRITEQNARLIEAGA